MTREVGQEPTLLPLLQKARKAAPRQVPSHWPRVIQIQAVIRPEKLDAVKDALVDLGINGMTVTPVQGFGKQMGHIEVYRGVEMEARLLPKVMVTAVVTDAGADAVVQAIRAAALTGEIGDGKIIISHVIQAIRIRTGESGDVTLE